MVLEGQILIKKMLTLGPQPAEFRICSDCSRFTLGNAQGPCDTRDPTYKACTLDI